MNRKRSITVVEHDPMLGMLLQEVLSDEGYATELWIECEGALECIRRTHPDLVILDLWLRRRGDGWQVFDHLQRDPATRQIPIILCTDDTLRLQMEGAQLVERAAAVLEKPFELDRLLTLVNQALKVEAKEPERVISHAERPALLVGT